MKNGKTRAPTTMTIELDLQSATAGAGIPGQEDFERWLAGVLEDRGDVGLTVRLVDAEEMQDLNSRYRGQDRPTNVLSFPVDLPEALRGEISPEPLGDVVICAPVVESEARAQGKDLSDHWAHLAIHGVLHLLGYDHQDEAQAEVMEALEIRCLSELGISNPYDP